MDARWSAIHGMIFLALVDNANYFEYVFHQGVEGENPAYGEEMIELASDREQMKRFFGEKDLREFAKDEETFMNFVSAINRYYYEGIRTPEEIYALMNLDDEAAQKRMTNMLEGNYIIDDLKDKSMNYLMIHASSLLSEITEQKLTSSNPLDYIDCREYAELVNLGEPALREFLATFAEGRPGDGLAWYVMMFACQDILGEARNTDLTPAEWYMNYAALDSLMVVPFAYYTGSHYGEEMEQKYGLREVPQKWSIIGVGKDQRVRAVYDALAERYGAKESGPYFPKVTFFAPYIHKIYEKGNTMQVFVTINSSKFVLTRTRTGEGFFERGGSVIPTRLDFEKQNDEWVLVDWIEAMDGSYYDDSIKEMCKGHFGLANEMMDGGEYHMLMWQNIIYYMNAYYGGMDIPVYISSYTDEATLEKVGKYIRVIPMFE